MILNLLGMHLHDVTWCCLFCEPQLGVSCWVEMFSAFCCRCGVGDMKLVNGRLLSWTSTLYVIQEGLKIPNDIGFHQRGLRGKHSREHSGRVFGCVHALNSSAPSEEGPNSCAQPSNATE